MKDIISPAPCNKFIHDFDCPYVLGFHPEYSLKVCDICRYNNSFKLFRRLCVRLIR